MWDCVDHSDRPSRAQLEREPGVIGISHAMRRRENNSGRDEAAGAMRGTVVEHLAHRANAVIVRAGKPAAVERWAAVRLPEDAGKTGSRFDGSVEKLGAHPRMAGAEIRAARRGADRA